MTPSTTPTPQPTFALARAIGWLTLTAGACCAIAWGILSNTYTPAQGQPAVAALVSGVAVLVVLTSLLALLPVYLLGPMGVMPTVAGYFMGMGLRMVLCLGSFLVARYTTKLPMQPIALTMAVMYVPLLFVEVSLVGRYLWAKDFLIADNKTVGQSSPTAAWEAPA
ncbi:MAG: hypothetical protein GC164_11060 [Phycisphaera sp.]|nr:hypothetical protein [Phycisphaera sp.]